MDGIVAMSIGGFVDDGGHDRRRIGRHRRDAGVSPGITAGAGDQCIALVPPARIYRAEFARRWCTCRSASSTSLSPLLSVTYGFKIEREPQADAVN